MPNTRPTPKDHRIRDDTPLGSHAAIRALPQPASTPAIDTDRSRRESTNVTELTGLAVSADQVIGLWLVDPEAGRERSDMM